MTARGQDERERAGTSLQLPAQQWPPLVRRRWRRRVRWAAHGRPIGARARRGWGHREGGALGGDVVGALIRIVCDRPHLACRSLHRDNDGSRSGIQLPYRLFWYNWHD
eukprot:5055651-Prymnesium_polylepis.2